MQTWVRTLIAIALALTNQRIALAELALMIAHARQDRTGLHTKKQVTWAWSQLGKQFPNSCGGSQEPFLGAIRRRELMLHFSSCKPASSAFQELFLRSRH